MSVLTETLREAANRFPARVAVVHEGRSVTYEDLTALSEEVAAGLNANGVGPGDLVALSLPNGLEYITAYLAVAQLGAAATGINSRYTTVERTKVAERAQPDLIVASSELSAGLDDHRVLVVNADPSIAAVDVLGELRQHSGPPHRRSGFDPATVEAVVFTSGTTGTPKGASFTSPQIRAVAQADVGRAWGEGGPQLVATGLSHVGFMTKLAGSLQAGSTMHVLTRWRARDALRTIAEQRIAYVGGVAAQISLLLAQPEMDELDLSAVRGLIVGGGPSPAALVSEARERFGAGYSVRYSSTESGGLGTLTAFDAPDAEVLGTVGRPRPGTEVTIRHVVDDSLLGTDEVGRVCLRSAAVMHGYWRDDAATAEALDSDGWLRTDDLGSIGSDGCLRIAGRLSEMYIRGGYNVFPQEVEAVLMHHPAVVSVAVVSRPSEVMGEIGVAALVVRPGHTPPGLDELREFAGTSLASYKLPEEIVVVDALPLTGMDKLDRRALTRHIGGDQTND